MDAKKTKSFLIRGIIIIAGLALIGCGGKQPIPPKDQQRNRVTLNFTDSDPDKGEIGGDVTLDVGSIGHTSNATDYLIFWSGSSNPSQKGELLAGPIAIQGLIGTKLYTVPENTKIPASNNSYFLLYASGADMPPKFTGVSTSVVDDARMEVQQAAQVQKVVTKVNNVLFDFDKSVIKEPFKKYLEQLFADVNNIGQMKLTIAGHCDERGSNEYNLALGERRAHALKRFLITLGFQEANIDTLSYGEEKPVDPGHNEEAWEKNRRAETKIEE